MAAVRTEMRANREICNEFGNIKFNTIRLEICSKLLTARFSTFQRNNNGTTFDLQDLFRDSVFLHGHLFPDLASATKQIGDWKAILEFWI